MPLIVANWKMKGAVADIQPYVQALAGYKAVLCPPMPLLGPMLAATRGTSLAVGAQDCHAKPTGSFTGDSGATMLAEIGCTHVIVGHSERRRDHGETDAIVWAKANTAVAAGLTPMICVGENAGEDPATALGERMAGLATYKGDSLIIAYEPIYAIGTGQPLGVDGIEAHVKLLKVLAEKIKPSCSVSILYGASVNAENAASILGIPGVEGLLVGAACQPVASFKAILDAANR